MLKNGNIGTVYPFIPSHPLFHRQPFGPFRPHVRADERAGEGGDFGSPPDFGWIVPSLGQNDFQTAYQVLVASGLQEIEQGRGDMWDSGKVQSARSVAIEYDGKPLASHRSYFWRVRTWNQQDQVSP
jgi:hypothetical protein